MKEEKTQDKKSLIEYTDYELDAMGNVIKYTEISRESPVPQHGKSPTSKCKLKVTITH